MISNRAIDNLRRLLDERGVDWDDLDGGSTWTGGDGRVHYARQEFTFGGLTDEVTVYHLTPEQAIAATLGNKTCKRVKSGTKMDGSPRYRCSDCGYGIGDKRWAYCPKCGLRIGEAAER